MRPGDYVERRTATAGLDDATVGAMRAELRRHGLALETDAVGLVVRARFDAARARKLVAEALTAGDDDTVLTCHKALDGSRQAIDAVWLALDEAGALESREESR